MGGAQRSNLGAMSYTNAEAREQLLGDVGLATDQIAQALACLGEAYEQLDERSGEQLEQGLFRPVQLAYGKAQRTHTEFAGRYGFPSRSFPLANESAPVLDVEFNFLV